MEQLKRYILYISVFFLMKYWIVSPYLDEQETYETEYDIVAMNVHKAKNLLANTENIKNAAKELEKIVSLNSGMFFSENITPKDALSLMQKKVRVIMEKSELEIVSITWGEPQLIEKLACIRLPLSFVVKAAPKALHQFFQDITAENLLLSFETLNIVSQRDKLQVTGQIIGLTRSKNANKQI